MILLDFPDDILEKIFSFISFDEVSRCRLVCRRFDTVGRSVLNHGFYRVEHFQTTCLKKVKAQLPRRESERRKHPLSRHCDILTAVETRLSLLSMTFLKFMEMNLCCFIPGKVLDEIYTVLRYVNTEQSPVRAHEVLQELRDLSSMAMEHFDEKIVPTLRKNKSDELSVASLRIWSSKFSASRRTSVSKTKKATHSLKVRSQKTILRLKSEVSMLNKKATKYPKMHADMAKEIAELRSLVCAQAEVISSQNCRMEYIDNLWSKVERYCPNVPFKKLMKAYDAEHGVQLKSLTDDDKEASQNDQLPEKQTFVSQSEKKRKMSLRSVDNDQRQKRPRSERLCAIASTSTSSSSKKVDRSEWLDDDSDD